MTDRDDDANTANGWIAPSPTRRELFAAAGIAAVAGTVPLAAHAAARNSKPVGSPRHASPDVIIIGGGFCGTTAARELGSRGLKVTLLEARNRLGGRTFTSEFAGHEADFGGTWVHWYQPHVWSEIHRYGMTLAETPGSVADRMIYLDYEGKRHEASFASLAAEFEASCARFFENAYTVMPRPAEPFAFSEWVQADTFSVQQKLDATSMSPQMKILVDTYFTLCGSNDPSKISYIDMMRWYALAGYNAGILNDAIARYKIKGGTKALLDRIASDSGADIRLGVPVKSVRDLGGAVEVVTEDGQRLLSKAVVSAVPLNVLSDISFSPALPSGKLTPSREKHAGQGTKVHILVKGEYPMTSMWAPSGKVALNYILWDGIIDGNTHLIGFGPSSDTLDINDNQAVQNAVRQFLPDATVIEAYGYDWGLDPYSKGVWGVSKPGQISHAIADLQRPIGRIAFANSDWANGWRGFIDGAIEQGIISARTVSELLKG